jgi:hypothetical protein
MIIAEVTRRFGKSEKATKLMIKSGKLETRLVNGKYER